MKRVFTLFFLTSMLLYSCQQKENVNEKEIKNDKTKVETSDSESISDMSIYNLTSVWTNQDSQRINLKSFKGDVVVIAMIYTSCKVACPRIVADMQNIEKQIPEKNLKHIQFVFVSIDPETDTPKRLKKFSIENMIEGYPWVLLDGSQDDTRELAVVLGVNYKEISPMLFSHSNIISVLNQKGELEHQQEGLGVSNEETVNSIIKLSNN